MNLLLDTHVLLWWLDDNPTLLAPAREIIADGRNLAFISAATIWEIVIKKALGKLGLPDEFKEILAREPFERLDVTADHAFQVGRLPPHHRDPFDRMLVAQCQVDGLTLVTRDPTVKRYNIPVLDA